MLPILGSMGWPRMYLHRLFGFQGVGVPRRSLFCSRSMLFWRMGRIGLMAKLKNISAPLRRPTGPHIHALIATEWIILRPSSFLQGAHVHGFADTILVSATKQEFWPRMGSGGWMRYRVGRSEIANPYRASPEFKTPSDYRFRPTWVTTDASCEILNRGPLIRCDYSPLGSWSDRPIGMGVGRIPPPSDSERRRYPS